MTTVFVWLKLVIHDQHANARGYDEVDNGGDGG